MIRFFPARKGEKSSLIAGFLTRHHVQHELISVEVSVRRPWHRSDEIPAIEVDGVLFINPNDGALRRILEID